MSLFSQFYIVNWFNRYRNVLKDTGQQVKYTRNEENIHALVGIKIINTIREEMPELFDEELEERIRGEAVEAFNSEAKIVDWMINGIQEDNLSAPIVKEFIKNRINSSNSFLSSEWILTGCLSQSMRTGIKKPQSTLLCRYLVT